MTDAICINRMAGAVCWLNCLLISFSKVQITPCIHFIQWRGVFYFWLHHFPLISVLKIDCILCLNIACIHSLYTKLCGHVNLNGLIITKLVWTYSHSPPLNYYSGEAKPPSVGTTYWLVWINCEYIFVFYFN